MRRKKKSLFQVSRERAFKLAKRKKPGKEFTGGDALIEQSHAMKVDLGFFHYRDFYFDILLKAIADLELTVGEKRVLNHLLDQDRFGIEVTEERFNDISCKHAKSKKGAVYSVRAEIPTREEPIMFFVKRCINPQIWEKSIMVEEFLSHISSAKGVVPGIKYSDPRARLIAYEFVDGAPLYKSFPFKTAEQKEEILRQTIESLFTLSADATSSLRSNRYQSLFLKKRTKPYASAPDRYGTFAELEKQRGQILPRLGDHESSFLNKFVIRGNSSLEDRLTAWDGRISERSQEGVKRKYKSVQPLLDAYKSTAEILDSEELYFSHGDMYLGNVLETPEGPEIIDWEDAMLAIRQFDLLKLLKKAGIPGEMEERLIDYSFVIHETSNLRSEIKSTISQWSVDDKRVRGLEQKLKEKEESLETSPEAQERLGRFRKAYKALEFHENLLCAAKYLNYSDKSGTPEDKQELREMANFYYTLALNYVRGKELEQRIKEVVAEVMDNRLMDLGKNLPLGPNPLVKTSFSNWGKTSVVEEMEGKKTTKAKVKKAAALSAASTAAAFIIGFGVHTHIETSDSAEFLEAIGKVPSTVPSTPHSTHAAKYSKMYNVNPLMLAAAVDYVAMKSTEIDLGAAAKYRNSPEQLTMSIAKKMRDAVEKHGENYPVVLAEVFAGNNAVESSKRVGITGRYVDFRIMEREHSQKVADTMALSGYYAKQRARKMTARWQR